MNKVTFGIYIPAVLRPMCKTRWAISLATHAIFIVNALTIMLDHSNHFLLRQWIDFCRPATNWFSHYNWAISETNAQLHSRGLNARIDTFDNVIFMNAVLYTIILVLIGCAIAYDFYERGEIVEKAINSYSSDIGRTPGGLALGALFLWVLTLLLEFTGFGYVDHPFNSDIYFIMIGFYFGISAYIFCCFLACFAAHLRSPGGNTG